LTAVTVSVKVTLVARFVMENVVLVVVPTSSKAPFVLL
jgi:hypothetical protein